MSDKSYVSMEQQVCMVCGKTYDTGTILLDRRLKESMEGHTVTGMGLCPEDEQKYKEGYLALVEINPSKSKEHKGKIKPEDAYRTGVVVHIRRTVARKILNIPIADDLPVAFIPPEVTAMLQEMMSEKNKEEK